MPSSVAIYQDLWDNPNPMQPEKVKAYFRWRQERMAGTRNCQVVVTASGKLKDEGGQVWCHYLITISFQNAWLSFKSHGDRATSTDTATPSSYRRWAKHNDGNGEMLLRAASGVSVCTNKIVFFDLSPMYVKCCTVTLLSESNPLKDCGSKNSGSSSCCPVPSVRSE